MSSENIIIIDLKKEKRREYDKDRVRPLYYKEQRREKTFCTCGSLQALHPLDGRSGKSGPRRS